MDEIQKAFIEEFIVIFEHLTTIKAFYFFSPYNRDILIGLMCGYLSEYKWS